MIRLFGELDFPVLISFTAGYKQFALDEIADPETRCKHQNAEKNSSNVDLAFHRCTRFHTLALTTSRPGLAGAVWLRDSAAAAPSLPLGATLRRCLRGFRLPLACPRK